jgi:hypothetical protein
MIRQVMDTAENNVCDSPLTVSLSFKPNARTGVLPAHQCGAMLQFYKEAYRKEESTAKAHSSGSVRVGMTTPMGMPSTSANPNVAARALVTPTYAVTGGADPFSLTSPRRLYRNTCASPILTSGRPQPFKPDHGCAVQGPHPCICGGQRV